MQFDTVVVGGGPAGASAGARLAQLGHSVCVVHNSGGLQPPSVESLSPGMWRVAERLRLADRILQRKFLQPELSLIRWGESEVQEKPQRPGEGGLLVDRTRFDRVLLQAAVEAGTHVVRSSRLRLHGSHEEGKWKLDVEGDSATTIECRYLIDASGKQGFLGRAGHRFGTSQVSASPRTVAICGLLEAAFRSATAMVEAVAEGWIWGVSLNDGHCVVMVFCDTEKVRTVGRKGLESLWRAFQSEADLFHALATTKLLGSLQLRDATASFHRTPIGKGFLRTGEANYCIDPLSSTGVEKAMAGGLTAGTVIHTILNHPARADICEKFYQTRQQEDVYRHAAWAAAFYREVLRFADRPFWYRRTKISIPDPKPAAVQSARDQHVTETQWTWHQRVQVRLANHVQIRTEPCVVGDEIEPILAVTSPQLGRPVAFLDGIRIGVILREVVAPMQSNDLASLFARHIPARQIGPVWSWLLQNRILEVIPAA